MAVIYFLIVAWVVFLLIRAVNRAQEMFASEEEMTPEAEAAPEINEKDIILEIRDALKAQGRTERPAIPGFSRGSSP